MWTPDVVFDNQVSLERAVSAIKNESDANVEITVLECSGEKCRKLGLDDSSSEQKKIFFKQTVKVEVNCPDMSFDDFPFDEQTCSFTLRDLRLQEETANENEKNAITEYFKDEEKLAKIEKAQAMRRRN